MFCTPDINGQHGQPSVLSCKINTSAEVENPRIVWLSWTKSAGKSGPEKLLLYNNAELTAMPGYSFVHEAWKQSLDVSLLIADTTVRHEGDYVCQVVVNSGSAESRSRLRVTGESLTLTAALLLAAAHVHGWPRQRRLEWGDFCSASRPPSRSDFHFQPDSFQPHTFCACSHLTAALHHCLPLPCLSLQPHIANPPSTMDCSATAAATREDKSAGLMRTIKTLQRMQQCLRSRRTRDCFSSPAGCICRVPPNIRARCSTPTVFERKKTQSNFLPKQV